MSEEFTSFENEVLHSVNTILGQLDRSFQALCLVPEVRTISRSGEGSPKYASELAVYFWDSQAHAEHRRDLVDIIEFHLVREGQRQASLEEITNWVEETVREILRKREEKDVRNHQ